MEQDCGLPMLHFYHFQTLTIDRQVVCVCVCACACVCVCACAHTHTRTHPSVRPSPPHGREHITISIEASGGISFFIAIHNSPNIDTRISQNEFMRVHTSRRLSRIRSQLITFEWLCESPGPAEESMAPSRVGQALSPTF